MKLVRPSWLLALAAMLALPGMAPQPALAAAPMAGIAAPGFYRFSLGDFEVTALSDGTDTADVSKLLRNVSAEKVSQGLAKWHMTGGADFSYNAYLINTGKALVLIDTGSGVSAAPVLGRLTANLRASGYRPEQVDEIYITHMHADHVGGLTAAGQAVFPNATVRADRKESEYWLNAANAETVAADMKPAFKQAADDLAPYIASGHFKPFDGAGPLVPGVSAVPSHGHTPGHSSYLVESRGQKLLLIGDLIHVAGVQFENPGATVPWDTDSKAAAAERMKDFTAAARDGLLVGAAHVSFPGLGYLAQSGAGFEWLPLAYKQFR